MTNLLLVSVGPVQDFIASARRCQDLWFGSWLLSDLARAVAVRLRDECGGADSLIFPASLEVDGRESKPAVANKILVLVPAGISAAKVADTGRAALDDELGLLAKDAFDRLPSLHFYREMAERQVRDLMEYVWVSVPVAGDSNEAYAIARDTAERLLGARKNVRGWKQVKLAGAGGWGGNVPKSSLDGLRESVLDEALYDAISKKRGELKAAALRETYFVRANERLCGVGLLKRVGSDGDVALGARNRPAFHSTSHVASAGVRTRMGRLEALGAFDGYAAALRGTLSQSGLTRLRVPGTDSVASVRIPYAGRHDTVATHRVFGADRLDGRVLYEGQLNAVLEDTVEGFAERPLSAQHDGVKPLRAALANALESLGLSTDDVPTYYAVLLADGDAMGVTLEYAGERAGLAGHRRVAKALDEFSIKCRAIVEASAGSLIYAGGDDVLALVPLHTALACSRELARVFAADLKAALDELSGSPSVYPTLSVGLGVSHHLDDMADARRLAAEAERLAKAHPGKNALAVLVQMRSGGRLQAVGSWAETPPLDVRLARWAEGLLTDEIPDKAAFELDAAMAPLLVESRGAHGQRGAEPPDLTDVAASLATRAFGRRRAGHGEKSMSSSIIDQMRARLSERDTVAPKPLAARIQALSQELQMARLFAKAFDVAFGSPSKPTDGGVQ